MRTTPDISGLVRTTDCNTKMLGIEAKYFTTSDYNKFTSEIVEVKRKEKNWLVNKSSISNLVKSDLITKLATFATKAQLKAE